MPKVYGSQVEKVEKTLWDKVLEENAAVPTVYFFSSENCQFCAAAYPYVEALEKKYEPFGVQVVQIDVERNVRLREAAKVLSWPYFSYAENGAVVGDALGWEDSFKTELEEKLGLTASHKTQSGLSYEGESQGVASGCGDSVSQSAEIAAGIQEAIQELEGRLKDHIDLAASRVIRALEASSDKK
jgi:thiol-disulfide isomerase/thioredoxin